MKKKNSSIILIFISAILFTRSTCISSEKWPEPSCYIVGSVLGSIGGGGIVAGGSRILGFRNENQGLDALPFAFTILGIGPSIGSCVGTTIVANDKTKVFSTNLTITAIPMILLYFIDKSKIVFAFYGAIFVPIISAVKAYKIDKQAYEKGDYAVDSTSLKNDTEFQNRSMKTMIQRDLVSTRKIYSALGKRINVYKIELLSIRW